jgi:hypothetical protein
LWRSRSPNPRDVATFCGVLVFSRSAPAKSNATAGVMSPPELSRSECAPTVMLIRCESNCSSVRMSMVVLSNCATESTVRKREASVR